MVQIIDACPASSAFNFCNTEVPPNERCGDSSVNSLDIDITTYQTITGTPFRSVRLLYTLSFRFLCSDLLVPSVWRDTDLGFFRGYQTWWLKFSLFPARSWDLAGDALVHQAMDQAGDILPATHFWISMRYSTVLYRLYNIIGSMQMSLSSYL